EGPRQRLAVAVLAGQQQDALLGLAQLAVAMLEQADAALVLRERLFEAGLAVFEDADNRLQLGEGGFKAQVIGGVHGRDHPLRSWPSQRSPRRSAPACRGRAGRRAARRSGPYPPGAYSSRRKARRRPSCPRCAGSARPGPASRAAITADTRAAFGPSAHFLSTQRKSPHRGFLAERLNVSKAGAKHRLYLGGCAVPQQ